MDLGTVKDKLDHYRYTSKIAFVSDLNLIWGNCLSYNTALGHPLRRKALAMQTKTKELVSSIPNIAVFREFIGIPEVQRQDSDATLYDDTDSDDELIMASRGRPALFSKSKSSVDRLNPKISDPLPRTIRDHYIPWEGSSWVSEDGTTSNKVIGGEMFRAQWCVTKAGKPRKRLVIACMACREKNIKCDPAKPKCVQCEKFGRDCRIPPTRLSDQTQPFPGPMHPPMLYPFASDDDHSEVYETPVHGAATHHDLVLHHSANSKTTLQQAKNEVDASMSPTTKRHQCPHCNTSFTRRHNLKSHLLTHNQDGPYACVTCGTRFRRLHDLLRHYNLHTGHRPQEAPYPGGSGNGRETQRTSADALDDLKSSQRPSNAVIAATLGSVVKLKDSTYGDEMNQHADSREMFKCSHTDCVEHPPQFSRESEWTYVLPWSLLFDSHQT